MTVFIVWPELKIKQRQKFIVSNTETRFQKWIVRNSGLLITSGKKIFWIFLLSNWGLINITTEFSRLIFLYHIHYRKIKKLNVRYGLEWDLFNWKIPALFFFLLNASWRVFRFSGLKSNCGMKTEQSMQILFKHTHQEVHKNGTNHICQTTIKPEHCPRTL